MSRLIFILGMALACAQAVYPVAHGVLKSIAGSELLVEVEQDHEMKFRVTRKTRVYSQAKEIKASSLEPGQTLDIEMESARTGALEAIRITVVATAAQPN